MRFTTCEDDRPSGAANESHKLVQVRRAYPADHRAKQHHRESEDILEPFDTEISLSAADEQPIFHDPYSREQL